MYFYEGLDAFRLGDRSRATGRTWLTLEGSELRSRSHIWWVSQKGVGPTTYPSLPRTTLVVLRPIHEPAQELLGHP
jgi:hypothetical protein